MSVPLSLAVPRTVPEVFISGNFFDSHDAHPMAGELSPPDMADPVSRLAYRYIDSNTRVGNQPDRFDGLDDPPASAPLQRAMDAVTAARRASSKRHNGLGGHIHARLRERVRVAAIAAVMPKASGVKPDVLDCDAAVAERDAAGAALAAPAARPVSAVASLAAPPSPASAAVPAPLVVTPVAPSLTPEQVVGVKWAVAAVPQCFGPLQPIEEARKP